MDSDIAIIVSLISSVVFIVVLLSIISKLSSIDKYTKKNTYILNKILEQNGGKLTKEDHEKMKV